jgi:hypothetical protein
MSGLTIKVENGLKKENSFNTPESLCQLCDPRFVYETFHNDPVVKLELLRQGGAVDKDDTQLHEIAERFGIELDLSTKETSKRTAEELFTIYALHSTLFTLDLTRKFIEYTGKKLIVLLSYGYGTVIRALKSRERFDNLLLDYLKKNKVLFVDTLASHIKDIKQFCISAEDYCELFYIVHAHYNPKGNHFFAFAIKNAIVEWLDPKPLAYR